MAPARHQKQRAISTSNGSTYGRAQTRSRNVIYQEDMSSPSPDPMDAEEAQPALQARVGTSVGPRPSRAFRTPRSIRHGMVANQEGNQFVLDWVRQNYRYEPNHNVPRSGMYEDYLAACVDNGTHPVNSATFGKLIRHVLPDISTRRLGTRGQSKYHYCGIRRRSSDLDGGYPPAMPFETSGMAPQGTPSGSGPIRLQRNTRAGHILRSDRHSSALAFVSTPIGPVDWQPSSAASVDPLGYGHSNATSQQQQQPFYYFYGIQQRAIYLDIHLPSFRSFRDGALLGDPTALDLARLYEQHCGDILKHLRAGSVDDIPDTIAEFYRDLPEHLRDLIVAQPEIIEAIWCWDCSLYDTILQTLLPDVYAPISYDTYKDLCSFTQSLQQTITSAMNGVYPERLVQQKCSVAAVFITQVKRHLNLNQMAQSASTILNYPNNLSLMLKDWESIDFNSVLDQALWVCECDRQEVEALLIASVPHLLRTNAGIERWIGWIQKVVEKYINGALRANKGRGYCIFYARQLIIKWSYYMNLAMKELICKNASCCDHFNKLHHFLGELIQYHVECVLAKTTWPDIQTQDMFSDTSTYVGLRPNTPKSMQQEPIRQ